MHTAQPEEFYAPVSPALQAQMAMPWVRQHAFPFPLDNPGLHYFYLARNGIYTLAQMWNLAGSEILFPAYFHGIEVDTLTAAGANLRFYPVHANMQVDPEEVLSCISPRTRAVYLIHYLGFPGPVVELSTICQDRGLLLIEDCALALLSKLKEKPLGSFGDAAAFCLYKTLPIPNGGALLVRNPNTMVWPETRQPSLTSTIAYTATAIWRQLQFDDGGWLHRMLQKTRDSARSVSDKLGVVPVGNQVFDPAAADLRMSRFCHWVMGGLDYQAIVERRRRNYIHLLNRLGEISSPVFDRLPEGICPLFYPIRTQNKPTIFKGLMERGIEPVDFWSRAPHAIPGGAFPEVEALRRTILEVPCHQDLSLQAMDRIADRVWELRADL